MWRHNYIYRDSLCFFWIIQVLGGVAIDFCVSIQRLDLLFGTIYHVFQQLPHAERGVWVKMGWDGYAWLFGCLIVSTTLCFILRVVLLLFIFSVSAIIGGVYPKWQTGISNTRVNACVCCPICATKKIARGVFVFSKLCYVVAYKRGVWFSVRRLSNASYTWMSPVLTTTRLSLFVVSIDFFRHWYMSIIRYRLLLSRWCYCDVWCLIVSEYLVFLIRACMILVLRWRIFCMYCIVNTI